MKRHDVLLLFFGILLCGNNASAATMLKNKEYTWSLAAMGDTIDKYYNYRCPVELPQVIKMGNIIKEKPKRSFNELVKLCKIAVKPMTKGNLYEAVKDRPCGTGKQWANQGEACEQFVYDLIRANNSYAANVRAATLPGTYVEKANVCGSDRVYKVLNVVPGKDSDNKIYLKEGGKILLLKDYTTQKNGTFINETAQTKETKAGDIRGVYNKSYIFLYDVTKEIYRLSNDGRGTSSYSAGAGMHLLPGGEYDFKQSWTQKTCDPAHYGFRVPGQTDTQAHTNGVIFKGQVVTLENLGHIITGMHQADSVAPDKTVEAVVEKLQGADKNTVIAAVAGGPIVAWGATDSKEESAYANDLRHEAESAMRDEKDDSTFAKTQTANEQRAYSLARRHMAKRYGLDASKINCTGECNKGMDAWRMAPGSEGFEIHDTDDFVTCYYKNGSVSKVTVYKFDDICNGSDKDVPDL